jgi:hypothetical protein
VVVAVVVVDIIHQLQYMVHVHIMVVSAPNIQFLDGHPVVLVVMHVIHVEIHHIILTVILVDVDVDKVVIDAVSWRQIVFVLLV